MRHGHAPAGQISTEYRIWGSMKTRCNNPKSKSYPRYGGRGITVCERWRDFRNFLADMGPRPSTGHTLDRIDNNGNYEPDNCRWATSLEQAQNSRAAKLTEADVLAIRRHPGLHTVVAAEYGVTSHTIFEIRAFRAWQNIGGESIKRERPTLPGTANPNAKLTEGAVREIRSGLEDGPRAAKRFGVSVSLIYAIRNRKAWRHI